MGNLSHVAASLRGVLAGICEGLSSLLSHIFRLSSCANDEIGAVIKNCKQTMNTINTEVLQIFQYFVLTKLGIGNVQFLSATLELTRLLVMSPV